MNGVKLHFTLREFVVATLAAIMLSGNASAPLEGQATVFTFESPPTNAPVHAAEETFRRAGQAMASAKTDADKKAAADLYQTAASAGHPEAQYNLATVYQHGIGVETNSKTACAWYLAAATNGHVIATRKLISGVPFPGESNYTRQVTKGKESVTFYQFKPGLARLRDKRLFRRAEYEGSLITYDEQSERSMQIAAGTTKPDLELAAQTAAVNLTKTSDDEWKVGDRSFFFRDDKVVGVEYGIGSTRRSPPQAHPEWKSTPPLADYDKAVGAAITTRFQNEARKLGSSTPGKVRVEFKLHADGKVSGVRVIESDFKYPQAHDLVSEQIIRDSAPFAPWPDEMKRILGGSPRTVRFQFQY